MRFSRLLILAIVFANMVGVAVHAQVMQSSSYTIESDSINIGGGRSTSASYTLEDTVGEVGTGLSSSTSYTLNAGYQQTLEDYLALTPASDVSLTPALGGATGGTSTGVATLTVTTDSQAGYQLTAQSSLSPAMQSPDGDTIPNYTPAGADPDYAFLVSTGEAYFGFTPEGADIPVRYQDSGGVCGVSGSDTTAACWDGLSTTPREIARSASPNHPTGTATTIRFSVGLGANAPVPAGTYYATTTVTALSL